MSDNMNKFITAFGLFCAYVISMTAVLWLSIQGSLNESKAMNAANEMDNIIYHVPVFLPYLVFLSILIFVLQHQKAKTFWLIISPLIITALTITIYFII